MMGPTHLVVGGATFLFGVTPIMAATGHALTPGQCAAGAVVAAGAAMLPDLDHPHATVSQSLGPVTRGISRVVSALAGGHRNGTHSLLGLAAVTAGLLALVHTFDHLVVYFAVCLFCLSLVSRIALEGHSWLTTTAVAAIGAMAALAVSADFSWIVVAVAGGYASHMLADALTQEGIPPLWPLSKWRFSIPLVRTDSGRERIVVIATSLACVWGAWAIIFGPAIKGESEAQPLRTTTPSVSAPTLRTSAPPDSGLLRDWP